MRILFLSQYYQPDITAAAFRISEMAELLAQKKHNNIYVITAIPHKGFVKPSHNDYSTISTFNTNQSNLYQSSTIYEHPKKDFSIEKNVFVTRVPIIFCAGHGFLNYIKHYCSFMINSIIRSFRLPSKFDFVIASSPPLFVGLAGLIIAYLKKSKFILDIRDIWPDSAVTAKQLKSESIAYKIGKALELFLYTTADKITCVSQPMADYIYSSLNNKYSKYFSFSKKQFPTVIYNGILEKYIKLIEQEESIYESTTKHNKANEFIIQYAGNLGHVQNIEILIEAAKILKLTSNTDVKFEIIGTGVKQSWLEDKIKEYQLDNIVLHPPIPKHELYKRQLKSAALLLLLVEDLTMEKTIPSKLFDYMAIGKPIIYCIKGEGKKILQNNIANIEFNSNSVESLVEAILKLKNNYPEYIKNAQYNRLIVKSSYTREKALKELENIFYSLKFE